MILIKALDPVWRFVSVSGSMTKLKNMHNIKFYTFKMYVKGNFSFFSIIYVGQIYLFLVSQLFFRLKN